MSLVARSPIVMAQLTALAVLIAGCSNAKKNTSASPSGSGSSPLAVNAGNRSCELTTATVEAGRHTFAVTNNASQVTEVYVYASGDRVMGEVENVGPSTKRNLIVELPAGDYEVVCKPGMVGDGYRTSLKVTGSGAPSQSADQSLQAAVATYRDYVESEAQSLVQATNTFTAAIADGNLQRAKHTYPVARLHYERIEPIAESFGDLDPLIDMRADDATNGTPFTGFHALEQLLFQKQTLTGAGALATPLKANVARLAQLVKTVEISPLTMGNGAKSLLDEVAKSKVTGEEERYSRIDLVDFAGNVDGARYVYTALRPALQPRNPQLVTTLDRRFRALVDLLATHQAQPGDPGYIAGSPYVSYDALTTDQIKALAVEVDSISEPLGQISGVVTSR